MEGRTSYGMITLYFCSVRLAIAVGVEKLDLLEGRDLCQVHDVIDRNSVPANL